MGSSPGVFRSTYTDKKTGEIRETSTWFATYWDPITGRTRKKYKFATQAAAKKWRADFNSSAGKNARQASAETLTLSQLLAIVKADYEAKARKTATAVDSRGKLLTGILGIDALARDIGPEQITAMIQRLRSDGYAPATINRALALLKRGFRIAHRSRPALVVPHMEMLREDNARQGFLEPGALEAILKHLPPDAVPAVQTMHATGWRVSEVLSRKWSDIESGFLLLRPGEAKNKRPRAYPIEPNLTPILKALPHPHTGQLFGDLTYDRLVKEWEKARAIAGYPKLLMHDFRRTAVRDLIKAGVDRDTAKKITGHETDSVFSRYRIVAGDDLKDAGRALSNYRKAQSKRKGKAA